MFTIYLYSIETSGMWAVKSSGQNMSCQPGGLSSQETRRSEFETVLKSRERGRQASGRVRRSELGRRNR